MSYMKILVTLSILNLSGCYSVYSLPISVVKEIVSKPEVTHNIVSYDPASQARIRIYNPVHVFPATSCNEWRAGKKQRAWSNILNPKFPKKEISLIGMPETLSSQQIMNNPKRINLDGFNEILLNANQMTIFESGNLDDGPNVRRSCSISVSFIPKPGKDYEVKFIDNYKTCSINITEILTQKTQNITQNVDVTETQKCS